MKTINVIVIFEIVLSLSNSIIAMTTIKITNKLSLMIVRIEKKKAASNQIVAATNHIWIYDRSGSMYGTLRELCNDLIAQAKLIPPGDTLTLIWFSGQGEYHVILKGFKITNKTDFTALETAINQNCTIIGSTCFSESLQEVESVIKDLSPISNTFSLCFFTDGYPVVNNYQKEVGDIRAAIDNVKGKLASTMFIGYGEAYNKELMSEMAERAGGALIHSRDLGDVKLAFQQFVAMENRALKQTVKAPKSLIDGDAEILAALSFQNGQVTAYNVDANGEVTVNGNAKDVVYVFNGPAAKKARSSKEIVPQPSEDVTQAIYAAAYILTQKTLVAEAMDLLNYLGDAGLIDQLVNSYTNNEYGVSEQNILQALFNPQQRFLKGKDTNHVAPDDAFCLLNLLDLLGEDDDAKFYPRHPKFQYKRIGKSRPPQPGYPTFVADAKAGVPFSTLTWNKEKLNLSVLACIPGTVELPNKEAKKLGLQNPFPTRIFRNYALIKDGKVNLTLLPITCSEETKVYLENLNLLVKTDAMEVDDGEVEVEEEDDSGILILDLSRLPTINRSMAKNARSATNLAHQVIEEFRLEAIMKVINSYNKEEKEAAKKYQPEIEKFLISQGIKNGTFSPPTQQVNKDEPRDYELVRSFDIKIKGASNLPKVDEVRAKMEDGKIVTLAQQFMVQGIEMCDDGGANTQKLAKKYKKKLNKLRSQIQQSKFALLLSKNWFEEFKSRENCQIEIQEEIEGVEVDTVVTFGVNEDKVEIDA